MGVKILETVGAREVEVGCANLTSLTFADFCCTISAANFVDFKFFTPFYSISEKLGCVKMLRDDDNYRVSNYTVPPLVFPFSNYTVPRLVFILSNRELFSLGSEGRSPSVGAT